MVNISAEINSRREVLLLISPIGYQYNFYPIHPSSNTNTVDAVSRVHPIEALKPQGGAKIWKTSPSECGTCNSRRYVDGSNDMNVSFKTPTNISPQASFTRVSAHESEHVADAVSKGNQPGAKLVSASVQLKVAVCPECGTPYIAGGETRTTIKYEENNPYESNRKAVEESLLKGMNVNYVA